MTSLLGKCDAEQRGLQIISKLFVLFRIFIHTYTLHNLYFIDFSYQFSLCLSIPFIMFLLSTAPPCVFDISFVFDISLVDKLALCVFTYQNQYPYIPSYSHVYVVCIFFFNFHSPSGRFRGVIWYGSLEQILRKNHSFSAK